MTEPKYSFLKPYGRPAKSSKYKPEYCDDMFEFFAVKHYEIRECVSFNKFGQKSITYHESPGKTPYFIDFARQIGVHRDTMNEWTRVHPEFGKTWKECKELQRNFLTENALRGNFNPTAYRFAAINYTNMSDKVEIESTNTNTNSTTIKQEDVLKISKQMKKDLK